MNTPPLTPDQSAAHEFLSELRTRIATQPAPYQHGVEARAMESLWELFGHARAAMEKYPGCQQFSADVTDMLNLDLRPLTAKWHRPYAEGQLNSRDGADQFRAELADVQKKLRDFAEKLHTMAYGTPFRDKLVPPVWTQAELDACFADLPFGLPRGTRRLPDEIIDGINNDEEKEVQERREAHGSKAKRRMNAVGAGFSGGGIRSATFSLGVTQVLAERGLLKDVDFLSTVSGGGYTGSFLSARLGTTETEADVARPYGPDTGPIRYVRHHTKFLNPVNLKDGWSMITSTLAGMVLNWTAPLLVIVVAALFAAMFTLPKSFWPTALGMTGVLTLFALVAYGGLLRSTRIWSTRGGWILGISIALTVTAGVCWLVNLGYGYFSYWARNDWQKPAGLGLAGALIAAGPVIIRFFPILQNPRVRRIALKILLLAAGLVIPLLALLIFYACRYFAESLPSDSRVSFLNPEHYGGKEILLGVAIALALVAFRLLNINLTAPHRLYRDRLAKTFIHTKGAEMRRWK